MDIRKFTLTFLGCGTSVGVPQPGCCCSICLSENRLNNRLRPSVLITTDTGINLLIDISPDFRIQVLTYKIKRIDGILITHAHADHILGLDDIRGFNFAQKYDIPLLATPNTLNGIKKTFWYTFNPNPRHKGTKPKLKLIEIDDYTPFNFADLTIVPFRMIHGGIFATGFKIGNIAYATDCNFLPDRTLEIMKDCEIVILDALRDTPHSSHYTIAEAINVINTIKPKQAYLTHMTHDVDYFELQSRLPSNIAPAYDGLVIEGNF
jgi:phosphoribosyl 1,2-cyclic phosphate phosphodiesterase